MDDLEPRRGRWSNLGGFAYVLKKSWLKCLDMNTKECLSNIPSELHTAPWLRSILDLVQNQTKIIQSLLKSLNKYYFRRGERDIGFFFEVSIGTRTYLNLGLTALTFPFSYMINDVLVQADFSIAFFTPSLWALKSN